MKHFYAGHQDQHEIVTMSIQKTITPIDNSVYLERPLSTQNEIDNVIENSKKSFQSWKSTSIDDRIKIINKFIDNLIALKPEVSKEICWQIEMVRKKTSY